MNPSRSLESRGAHPSDLSDLIRLESDIRAATQRALRDGRSVVTMLLAVQARLLSLSTDATLLAASGDFEQANKLYRIAAAMIREFGDLVDDYTKVAESLAKPQLPKDLFSGKYRDPWRGSRQHASRFAHKWLPSQIATSIHP